MKKIGGYIAIFGVIAILAPFFNLKLQYFSWIYDWGETAAWAIKIGFIVIGAALYLLASKTAQDTD